MNIDRPLVAMEAEHGVLGALMHEPDQCEDIGAFLAASDFSDEDNGALYVMILGCHSRKVRPDPITLAEVRADLPSGDMTMVRAAEVMRGVPSASNGKHYAKILVERAKARQLYEVGQRLIDLSMTVGAIPEQISQAQSLVMDLNAEDEQPDVITMKQALGPVFEDMQDRLDGKQVIGQDFGLADLDRIVRCIRPGNLVIIAGRPGTGKTVLGTNLADRIAVRKNGSALVFSLEMPNKELAKRSLAAEAGVHQDWIETGKAILDEDACTRITAAVAKLHKADVRICDKGALTFSRICSIARFEHRARKLDVIVVDYLSLIATDPTSKIQNRNLELGSYTRGFKALAKQLGIPVVVLAQLNRGIENRTVPKPKMSDLRDSGEIEQDADVIIMAHRDMDSERGKNGLTEIDVVKVRHAKPAGCLLQFQGEFARFVNAAAQPDEPEEAKAPAKQVRKSSKSLLNSYNPRGGF
ncbi:DnaB-like helicase C-terminal domain-containing protein [Pseudomonas chlororaphis]|uniref:DnaB-like helicase C-terminal domain-containing protein n=1 Tax=Pseudomonas chlororaphis TaxID=587753 RepID=UPI001B3246DB|nr:DnaB-like helicase C-terminal domain-containing protein [Pseudomonas chlororaphis]MBP5060226.1 AAA family ATPase [Pseudomonas chlororaphis]MBP5143771.1 AAA family ATPase [Pseudomonas chlororaphis]